MSAIKLQDRPTPEELLQAVEKLSPEEFNDFARKVAYMQERRSRHLDILTESEIIERMNGLYSLAFWDELHRLNARRQAEILTPQEHVRLMQLNDEAERKNVERLYCLMELANRRGVSLEEIMRSFGILKPHCVFSD